ncbi:MAG: hypothetical protein CL916_15395 [Deltaproteobacteria bacterium]|nr:hypothetical protein [Deltaproteobacteria bacterium]
MSEKIRQFLIESGRGEPQSLSPFKNKLDLPGGRHGTAWLCSIDGTLFIVAIQEGIGRAIEVPLSEIRILNNFWGSAIQIGETTFSLPFASKATETIASALLYNADPISIEEQLIGAWTCELSYAQRLWIEVNFEEDEQLIAAIETATEADFTPKLSGDEPKEYIFILSDRRCGLLGMSEYGEGHFFPLAKQELQIERGFGRSDIRCGPLEWKATMSNSNQYETIAPLPALDRFPRIRHTVLQLTEFPFQQKRLFGLLKHAPDPINRFIAIWMHEGGEITPILEEMMVDHENSKALCSWFSESNLSEKERTLIVEKALSISDTPEKARWSLPIHQYNLENTTDPTNSQDLAYIEHLLFTGNDARTELKELIKKLPNEEWSISLPMHFTAIKENRPLNSLTFRAYSLLEQYTPEKEKHEIQTQLLRHSPLSLPLAQKLSKSQEMRTASLGKNILDIIQGSEEDRTFDLPKSLPLLSQEDQVRLKHPISQSGGMFDGMTEWVAKTDSLDFGILQKYCAQVSQENHPLLTESVRKICAMLDMPVPPIYVSWGEHNIGILSHESPSPFIIIGGEHLKKESPHSLSLGERTALLAMELTHIKYKSSRITSNEVWQGVLHKGGVVLEGAFTLLPMLKHLPTSWMQKVETYNTIRSVIPSLWFEQLYKRTPISSVIPSKTEEVGLSIDPSTILLAYRALQLNADRMALIATGSLYHTIASFFIGFPTLLPFKESLKSKGIQQLYTSTLSASMLGIQENITLRAASLISFYLSEEYQSIQTSTSDV